MHTQYDRISPTTSEQILEQTASDAPQVFTFSLNGSSLHRVHSNSLSPGHNAPSAPRELAAYGVAGIVYLEALVCPQYVFISRHGFLEQGHWCLIGASEMMEGVCG